MGLLKSANIMLVLCLNLLTLYIQGNPAFPDLSFHGQTNFSRLEQLRSGESVNKDYEVVQLRILSKRSADDKDVIKVNLSAFGKKIHLRLQKNDDFNDNLKALRVYETTMSDDSFKLEEIMLEGDVLSIPYIDPVQMAAVTIHHAPDGVLQMDGVIGDDMRIKPASADDDSFMDFFDYDGEFTLENDRKINTFGKNRRNVLGNSSSMGVKRGLHLVYRSLTESKMSDKSLPLDDDFNNIDFSGNERHRKGPLHAWPEVLLMVDYNTYEAHLKHGFNDIQIRDYYISFMNAVDLRFKTLTNPRISLVLSQIVIFKSMDATPFLKENLFPGTNIFNGDRAIADLGRHLYSAKKKSGLYLEFDLAVLLTNLDVCTEAYILCNRDTLGLAYLMGACTTQQWNEQWMGAAIVEDHGGFDGILTVAHEIGHLLGADHDGTPNFRLGLQHSLGCNMGDGYIMSHNSESSRIFQWSKCSIKQFRYFLKSERASCLFNQPSYRSELETSLLPGIMLSLDEQCRRIVGTRACAWDSRVCISLRCYVVDHGIEYCSPGLAPAAEGSPCGEDLHCRHGKCVSKSLIYRQAWNMENRNAPKITTTTEKPIETCTEDSDEFFCDSYFWTIGRKEACKNSRISEECCYSHKVLC